MRFFIKPGLLALVFFTTTSLNAEPSAFDVFIESCRNSGENLNLIQSGYAEFDRTSNTQRPSEAVQEIVGRLEGALKADLDKAPPELVKMRRESLQRVAREMEGKEDTKGRYKLFFTGNDVFFASNADVCKRYREIEQYDLDQKRWHLYEFAIMKGSPNGERVTAGFMPGTSTAKVEEKMLAGYEFQRFGRMQNSSAYHDLLLCMEQQDRRKFQITEKTILSFREKMKEKNFSFEMAGIASYDDNKTATIVEIKSNGQVLERFWIDTSRGYICPLIQCFDESGKVEKEYKSSRYFLNDRTALWYPENYEETRVFPFPFKDVYTLNRETFQLNHAISDKMFTLDIPEGTKVIDKRSGEKEIKYTAMDRGELSLTEGGLDLGNMAWLMREGDLTYGRKPSAVGQTFRYVSMALGIFFILLALAMKFRQRRGQKE